MHGVAPSTLSVIGFLDVDGYECQLYQRHRPWTRNKPCIVVNACGRIVSASPEAKRLGITRDKTPNERDVRKLFPINNIEIFRKTIEYGKPETKKTRHGTWELLDAVKKFCSRWGHDVIIELASSDEIFLELSSTITRGIQLRKYSSTSRNIVDIDSSTVLEGYESRPGPFQYPINQRYAKAWMSHAARDEERLIFGALFMRELANYVKDNIGLHTSSGVASNRFTAKLACSLNRPGKTTVMTDPENAIPRISRAVQIADIPGLGGKIGQLLKEELFVTSLYQLRRVTMKALECVVGAADMAVRVYSLARGRDNTPIIAKEMKNTLRCNKPGQPIISTVDGLDTAIRNLCAECSCLLEEEKLRHKRIISSIKVEFAFKYVDMVQQSELFDLSNYDDFVLLPRKILEHIISAWKSSEERRTFVVDTLTFVMKDFIPTVELPLKELLTLAVTAPRIQELKVQSTPKDPSPRFSIDKVVSSFATKANQEYYYESDIVSPPKIIPSKQYSSVIPSYLGSDYQRAKLSYDQMEYYELKHKQFSKWLQDFQFLEKVNSGQLQKPQFITFNGRLTDTMMTPHLKQFGDWTIYAMNVAGIIFLWDEKKNKTKLTELEFYGFGFQNLLYDRGDDNDLMTDFFEHVYSISSTTFGEHKLLIVNEIDGVDENGNLIELRLMNNREGDARVSKLLKLWSSNVIANVNNFIIGIYKEQGALIDIQQRTLPEVETELELRPEASLHFQDRLLSWIKLHLQQSSCDVVMKYSWVCGSRCVTAELVQQQQVVDLVVPRLYAHYLRRLDEELCTPEAEDVELVTENEPKTNDDHI